VQYKGERRGVIEFRKHYAGYLRSVPGAAAVRSELMQFVESAPIGERVRAFVESSQPVNEEVLS
jgi:tRNA-dihydrouridine synthase